MGLIHWAREEGPRERLLRAGPECLSDAELLSLFLSNGSKGQTSVDLARELIRQFGNISRLLATDAANLMQFNGLGPARAARLAAMGAMHQRQLASELRERRVLTSSRATRDFLRLRLGHRDRESFSCVYLSTQHHVLEVEELFLGTIDGAAVYPREVVKRCLFFEAAAVIFAHNHPSGSAEPSQADIAITRKLQAALTAIDIRVLDHLVVTGSRVASFAERGLL